jgi:hypothetical protein
MSWSDPKARSESRVSCIMVADGRSSLWSTDHSLQIIVRASMTLLEPTVATSGSSTQILVPASAIRDDETARQSGIRCITPRMGRGGSDAGRPGEKFCASGLDVHKAAPSRWSGGLTSSFIPALVSWLARLEGESFAPGGPAPCVQQPTLSDLPDDAKLRFPHRSRRCSRPAAIAWAVSSGRSSTTPPSRPGVLPERSKRLRPKAFGHSSDLRRPVVCARSLRASCVFGACPRSRPRQRSSSLDP